MLRRKQWVKFLIIISVIVPIGFFIYHTDFEAVVTELSDVGIQSFYIVLITASAYLLGTYGWWVCLGKERHHISLLRLFMIRQVGETVGLYNPSSVIGGDLLKVVLLRNRGIAKDTLAESVVVSRVTAVLSQLSLSIVAACWLLGHAAATLPSFLRYVCVFCMLLLAIGLILFVVGLGRPPRRAPAESAAPIGWFKILQTRIVLLTAQTRCFFRHKKRAFWLSYLFFALHWVVGSLEFYLILIFLGYPVSPMHGILLDMGVIVIKSTGAFIPGQLGIEELGNKLVLAAIGIQASSIWITVSILRRARQLFWIGIGVVCYLFIRKSGSLNFAIHGDPIRQP